jgi:hypothetical protein
MADKGPSIKERLLIQQENVARRALIEDLFWDLHRSRKRIYWMNFIRGILFGVGSVLGATIVVAILVTVLGLLVDIPGGIGDFVSSVIDIVQNRQ